MAAMGTGSKAARWVLGLLLAATGCGYEGDLPTPGEPPPPPSAPSQAGVALFLSSSPVNAGAALDGGGLWVAEWTLTVQETAGISGDIESVRATLTDPGGAPLAETELGPDEVSQQLGGTNHLPGGGSGELLMALEFDFPADVSTGDLLVTVELTDERGNVVQGAAEDVVQICIPTLLAPEEGGVMDNGCTNPDNGILWEFDWTDCPGSAAYHFYLKLENEEEPLFDREGLTASSFTVLEDRVVPEEVRFGWSWRVRAQLNGVWSEWTPDQTFSVEPVNTDCVEP